MKTSKLIILRLLDLLFHNRLLGKRYIGQVESMRRQSGLPFTIKYMKTVRLHITRYISGTPLRSNSSRVSLTNGFPTKFLYLKRLIDSGNPKELRFVLTLLGFTRSIRPTVKEKNQVVVDYSSISNPFKGKIGYTIPDKFIDEFIKKYNLSFTPRWDNSLHYVSNKSSPLGKATLTGPFALFHMGHWNLTMLDHFQSLIGEGPFKVMIGEFLEVVFKDHRAFHTGISTNGIGKISVIEDPELKMRPIAMVDYYSQLVLRPIHDGILKKLRNLPQDRTFTQNPFNNWGKTMGHKFWSLDLTSATDRFPISLQERLIAGLLKDPVKARAWRDILVDRDYKLPTGGFTRYSVGQPMGAYSSWTTFTLTHHMVVQYAAHLCGIQDFNRYILLGDDIVINHDKVARAYIRIMTKLGVDISVAKTHVSKNTYEFAKRWVRKGVEISGLPLRGIVSNINNLPVVVKQLVNYLYSNATHWGGSTTELILNVFKGIKIRKRFLSRSNLLSQVEDIVFVIRQSLSLNSYEEIRRYLCQKIKIEELIIPKGDLVHGFIREILCLGLVESAEDASFDLTRFYDKFESEFRKGDFDLKLLHRHPMVLAVYNKILDMKRTLMKVRNMDEMDLIDAMSLMRLDKPDKLMSNLRNSSTSIAHIDMLWRRGFKKLHFTTEMTLMIGEFDPTNVALMSNDDEGYFEITALKPWESYYISNLSDLSDKLEILKTPVTTNMYF
uniref:RNA-dependent RNA polymerase n=1 Tax=Sclerotinia sclerotiorum mitovirus 1 HC025-A TaxID=2231666 RepID=A0A2Z4QKB9_9VIRU|nr:RNA-dependent RNA polymerase [Sclerotinia sclerotiorum mitovirus 1 HC025-A]